MDENQPLPGERDPQRHRGIFVVQLEVTSLLLEALTRKLGTLQNELETSSNPATTEGSLKAKENLTSQLILTIEKVQNQWEQLEQEYTHQAIGVLRCSNTRGSGKSNRSQPAIGLKQTQKARPTIFGTVADDHSPRDNTTKRVSLTLVLTRVKHLFKQF
ncbi:uncharacterized protein [Cherax quadricarinatus]